MFHILQSAIVPTEETLAHADSVKVKIATAAETLVHDPSQFFSDLMKDLSSFGLKLLLAIAIYFIGAWLIRRINNMLRRIFERRNTEKTIVTFITSLVSITLTALLIVIAISTLGVNTTSIAALLAAGGMAIGMALSGTVQNFAGGIMILFFKPFKAGDYIKTQGLEGTVLEVTIVNTRIRTYDNAVIILPNGALFNGNITNLSQMEFYRVKWEVDVAYDTDARLVKEALMEIAASDPRIFQDKVDETMKIPEVVVNALKDSTVEFQLKGWVKTSDYWDVLYAINEKIYTELPKKGIVFAFPQMDLNIKQKTTK